MAPTTGSPPAIPNICACVEHRCIESRLEDGRPGKVIKNPATLRKHRRDEEGRLRVQATRDMVKDAIDRKTEILKDDEESLVRRLEKMTLTGVASAPPHDDRPDSRTDTRSQDSIDMIGGVKDKLGILLEQMPRRSSYSGTSANYSVDQTCDELRKCKLKIDVLHKSMQGLLKSHRVRSTSAKALRDEVLLEFEDAFRILKDEKRYWNRVKKSPEQGERLSSIDTTQVPNLPPSRMVTTEHHYAELLPHYGFIAAAIFMVAVCRIALGFSRRGCTWIFDMISIVVHSAIQQALGVPLNSMWHKVIGRLPKDERSAIRQLRLEGCYMIYATCPSCHQLHAKDEGRWGVNGYPSACGTLLGLRRNNRCKALLLRSKTIREASIKVPIRPFIVFDFKEWVGEILSRPKFEKAMDSSHMRGSLGTEGAIEDIFQASFLRRFHDRNGKLFVNPHPGQSPTNSQEGRYLFSLGLDFFNPLTNKQAGKKLSVGLLAMTCMSLPLDLRYRAENLFLAGIIPSPEPPVTHVNNYLRPLVDVLLLFWEGIWFTRTADHQSGRLILIALVLVVCDLPAARKLLRLGSHNHRCYCSRCWCRLDDRLDPEADRPARYNRLDYDHWTPRNPDEVRRIAISERDATSEKARADIFRCHGVRWSELLRLPYFDPVSMVVVDPMHNLFLGLLQEHCRSILDYQPGVDKAKDKFAKKTPGPGQKPPYEKFFHVELSETDLKDAGVTLNDDQNRKNLAKIIKELEGHVEPGDRARLLKSWKKAKLLPILEYLVNALVAPTSGETFTLSPNANSELTRDVLAVRIVDLIQEAKEEVKWVDVVVDDNSHSDGDLTSGLRTVINRFGRIGWVKLKDPNNREELRTYLSKRRKDVLEFLYRSLRKISRNYVPEMTTLDLYPGETGGGWNANSERKNLRLGKRGAGRILAEKLFEWRIRQKQSPRPALDVAESASLSKRDIEEIQNDISKTIKPSWVTPVPSSSHGHGKLKADQWRMFATLHLVVSLIRLWSPSVGSAPTNRRKEMLDVTMMLVSAVIIATSRVTSQGHADKYHGFMTGYLEGLMRLLPGYNLHPNHHCAMHLHEFMLMFGPVHSWWAFAMERMIGGLQRIPTNHKPGEYEETIARTYSQRARLQAFFLRMNVPESLKSIVAPFSRVLNPDPRGTLTKDISELSESRFGEQVDAVSQPAAQALKSNWRPLPIEIACMFDAQGLKRPSKIQLITRTTQGGVNYSTKSFHHGNAQVMIGDIPAVIEKMLQDDGGQIYALVRRHRRANVSFDPYRQYPTLQASLWGTNHESDMYIIKSCELKVHFARCDIQWEGQTVAAVVALSRTWSDAEGLVDIIFGGDEELGVQS